MDYFEQEFGFTPLEVQAAIALLGLKYSDSIGDCFDGSSHYWQCGDLQLRVSRALGQRGGDHLQQPVLRQPQVQYSTVQCSTVQYNNQYYANLRDPGLDWTLTQRACTDLSGVEASECAAGQTTEWQYTSGGSGFNLPADMALYQVRGPPSLHCMIIIII